MVWSNVTWPLIGALLDFFTCTFPCANNTRGMDTTKIINSIPSLFFKIKFLLFYCKPAEPVYKIVGELFTPVFIIFPLPLNCGSIRKGIYTISMTLVIFPLPGIP